MICAGPMALSEAANELLRLARELSEIWPRA
jgi:hypothetical protein